MLPLGFLTFPLFLEVEAPSTLLQIPALGSRRILAFFDLALEVVGLMSVDGSCDFLVAFAILKPELFWLRAQRHFLMKPPRTMEGHTPES